MSTVHSSCRAKVVSVRPYGLAARSVFERQPHRRPLPLRMIDTDRSTRRSRIPSLAGRRLQIRTRDRPGSTNDADGLMELLKEEADFVIDNGAASFVPLSNYLTENAAISMLVDAGRRVCVHSVITGQIGDTINGFNQTAGKCPTT